MTVKPPPRLRQLLWQHPACLGPLSLILFHEWCHSRVARYFWQGLPAVLLAVVAVGLVLLDRQTPRGDLTERYRAAANQALEAGQLEEADVYFRRLAELDPLNAATQYGLALTRHGQGEIEAARRLMTRAAAADRAGYAPAHFWLAQDMVANHQELTPPMSRELLHHLVRTVQQEPDHVEAQAMLGQLLLALGHAERAAQHLARAVDSRPELRLTLVRTYTALRRKELARQEARRAMEHFRARAEAEPENVDVRLAWAEALMLLDKAAEAVRVLEAGWANSGDDRYRAALVTTHLFWSDQVRPRTLGHSIELLQRAMEYAPHDPGVLNRLALLAAEGDEAAPARAALQDLLLEGRAPATVHLILGSAAAEGGDLSAALLHLEQAYRLNPRLPLVVNNLAWVLARTDPPQLDRAAKLADVAVKLLPNDPDVRETRGQILAQIGRHHEALTDLQIALQANPDYPPVHQTLAMIYEQLGERELANRHRHRAK